MNPRISSIVSYPGILWLVLEQGLRNDLSRYHLKQGLGLLVVTLMLNAIVGIVVTMIPTLLVYGVISVFFLILTVLGIIKGNKER